MIGIIFVGNIEYCPYLEKYKKVLAEKNVEYKVLYWNRELSGKAYPYNYISFDKKMNNRKKKIYKVMFFIQFAIWLKKHIRSRQFDKLIILDTISGILLKKILLSQFKGKYIFDIRDYSYEKFKPFYNREKKLINYSYFTCISSKGFKSFLPKNKNYIMAHNFNYKDISSVQRKFNQKQYGEVLNFVWIGSVRYYEHQVTIIDKLGNDSRFNIIIHGTGPDLERLKQYCIVNKIQNIKFTGRYNNNEKSNLLSNADIINNSYDPKIGYEVKYAISNKFYDGIIFRIPQLVEIGTFKQNKVEELEIGIGLETDINDFSDRLYEYYFSIDEDKFNANCEKKLNNIKDEDKLYLERIRSFLSDL